MLDAGIDERPVIHSATSAGGSRVSAKNRPLPLAAVEAPAVSVLDLVAAAPDNESPVDSTTFGDRARAARIVDPVHRIAGACDEAVQGHGYTTGELRQV